MIVGSGLSADAGWNVKQPSMWATFINATLLHIINCEKDNTNDLENFHKKSSECWRNKIRYQKDNHAKLRTQTFLVLHFPTIFNPSPFFLPHSLLITAEARSWLKCGVWIPSCSWSSVSGDPLHQEMCALLWLPWTMERVSLSVFWESQMKCPCRIASWHAATNCTSWHLDTTRPSPWLLEKPCIPSTTTTLMSVEFVSWVLGTIAKDRGNSLRSTWMGTKDQDPLK